MFTSNKTRLIHQFAFKLLSFFLFLSYLLFFLFSFLFIYFFFVAPFSTVHRINVHFLVETSPWKHMIKCVIQLHKLQNFLVVFVVVFFIYSVFFSSFCYLDNSLLHVIFEHLRIYFPRWLICVTILAFTVHAHFVNWNIYEMSLSLSSSHWQNDDKCKTIKLLMFPILIDSHSVKWQCKNAN